MIAEVLDRAFVLHALEQVQRGLRDTAADDRRSDAGPALEQPLERDDLLEAAAALEAAGARERTHSSGQHGFVADGGDDRRGEEPADLDSLAFISHDPVVSNLQSALEAFLEEEAPEWIEAQDAVNDDRRGGAEPSMVTDRRLRGPGALDDRRVGEQFSVTDVRWIGSLFAQGVRRFRGRHPFNPTPAPPRPVADRARLVVVGDWGSGIPRAVKVAERMRAVLQEGRHERLEQHAVHLGDVYYSGWGREYDHRFLPHWPVLPEEAGEITSWSLNANHDMYAGGHGYFKTLLADPRFKAHAGSSFFSIHNSHWRILGLDTGYDEGKLHGGQAAWVGTQVAEAKQAGQKVMLMSHYQLFSPYESAGSGLRPALGGLLASGAIHSWLWGHEHREVLYRPHAGLQFAACLGNGGVPAYMTKKEDEPRPDPVLYENRARMRKGLESWGYFGFAVLDLDGPTLRVRLVDEDGRTHHEHTVA